MFWIYAPSFLKMSGSSRNTSFVEIGVSGDNLYDLRSKWELNFNARFRRGHYLLGSVS